MDAQLTCAQAATHVRATKVAAAQEKPGSNHECSDPTGSGSRWRSAGPFMRHRPQLDGVRGAALLMVLCMHYLSPLLPKTGLAHIYVWNLWAGVPVFFALSGFLVGAQIDRGLARSRFYRRRIARIAPLWAAVAIYSVLVFSVPVGAAVFPNWWQANGLELHASVRPIWSLVMEETFYLVAPFVRRPERWLAALVAWKLLLAFGVGSQECTYYLGQLDCIAIGWCAWRYRSSIRSGWARTGVALGMGSWVLGPWTSLVHPAAFVVVVSTGSAVLGAALVLLAYRGELWEVPWLEAIGRYSYGLYLLHTPLLLTLEGWLTAEAPLAVATLTLGPLAWVSMHGLERPAQRLIRGDGAVAWRARIEVAHGTGRSGR